MLSTHGPGLYSVALLMPEARSIDYRYMLQKQLCLKAQPLFFLIVLLYPHSHLIVCEMGKNSARHSVTGTVSNLSDKAELFLHASVLQFHIFFSLLFRFVTREE